MNLRYQVRLIFRGIAFFLVVHFTLASGANEASWPVFRGAQNLAGVAQGKLEDSLELRWTFKTGEAINSSAVIEGNKVFFGSDDGSVYAVELATGKKVWSFKTGDAVESSPLVRNGTVYIGSNDAQLYALDAATGALKWKYSCGDKIPGAPIWTASPSGDHILVGSYDNKMHCVDAVTGQEVWVYNTGNYINGTPAIEAGRIVFGGCDAYIHALAVADSKLLQEIGAGAYVAGSCAVVGDFAYAGHYGNQVICANLADGKIVWTFTDSTQPFFSTPAVTEKEVVIGGRDHKLYCLERSSGKSLWVFPTHGKVDSSPVVCGDSVVFGSSDGSLYRVDLKTGKKLWSYEIGKEIKSSPAITAGFIVIGADDGCLYAFGPKKGQ